MILARRPTTADELEQRLQRNPDVPAEVILENMKVELQATRRSR